MAQDDLKNFFHGVPMYGKICSLNLLIKISVF